MPNCPVCGKAIPQGTTYCSKECVELAKEKQDTQLIGRQRHQDLTLDVKWILGSGASARERNIETIISLLKQGISPEEILDSEILLCFKDSTILEYIRVASRILAKRNQQKGS